MSGIHFPLWPGTGSQLGQLGGQGGCEKAVHSACVSVGAFLQVPSPVHPGSQMELTSGPPTKRCVSPFLLSVASKWPVGFMVRALRGCALQITSLRPGCPRKAELVAWMASGGQQSVTVEGEQLMNAPARERSGCQGDRAGPRLGV